MIKELLKKILIEENNGLQDAYGGEVMHINVGVALRAMQRAYQQGINDMKETVLDQMDSI